MKLLLHCGGKEVEYNQLREVRVPEETATHTPIPHHTFVDRVKESLLDSGYSIDTEQHALSGEGGARYFGILGLSNKDDNTDQPYQWTLGMRNSHDKTFSAQLVAGSRVFVCDNLAFSGVVNLARKHTRYIMRDLPNLAARAVGMLGDYYGQNDARYAQYQEDEITDERANHLMIQSLVNRTIPSAYITDVVREWREPTHKEFEPRTTWSLFNAFTDVMTKRCSPNNVVGRNRALHGLLDAQVGFKPTVLNAQ